MPKDTPDEETETTNDLLRDIAEVLRGIENKLADLLVRLEQRP